MHIIKSPYCSSCRFWSHPARSSQSQAHHYPSADTLHNPPPLTGWVFCAKQPTPVSSGCAATRPWYTSRKIPPHISIYARMTSSLCISRMTTSASYEAYLTKSVFVQSHNHTGCTLYPVPDVIASDLHQGTRSWHPEQSPQIICASTGRSL